MLAVSLYNIDVLFGYSREVEYFPCELVLGRFLSAMKSITCWWWIEH